MRVIRLLCICEKVNQMWEMPDHQMKSYLWIDEMFQKPYIAMRCLFLVIALTCCQFRLQSQDRYFLFLQTENEQAFYARVLGRTLSSSANGYLILPRIADTTLTITIGFPKRLFPEQTFQVKNIRSDRGFLLKNLPERGWSLLDIQSADMLLAVSAEPPRPTETIAKSGVVDPFSELLSTVIADSSLIETPILVKATPEPEKPKPTINPVKAGDLIPQASPAVAGTQSDKKPEQPVSSMPKSAASRVNGSKKLLEQIDGSGVQLVFSDESPGGKTDTISIFIPKGQTNEFSATSKNDAKTARTSDSSVTVSRSIPDRADCKSFINARDLGLLRRRMEMLSDEDAKVSMALRSFRETCFSTEQVRNLLLVFGREEGRFKLLDAAYPFVSDPSRFPELESVLKDSYFIYRFRKKTSGSPRQ